MGCTEAKTFSQSTIDSTVENGKLHPRKLLKKKSHLRVLRLAAYKRPNLHPKNYQVLKNEFENYIS
jgi:hypothetical protein